LTKIIRNKNKISKPLDYKGTSVCRDLFSMHMF
jgi:hypothetical protein